MKLKLIKTAAALAVVATFLAGCKFEGTTTDFKDAERNDYTAKASNYNNPEELGTVGTVAIANSPLTITKAADHSYITVNISSKGRLDEDSIKSALTFYTLSDNDAGNVSWAPKRGTALTVNSTLISTAASNLNVTTTVLFDVNTLSVTTRKIALVADATKLKEKTGQLILNGDGNDKCGEESDSYIYYITVSLDKDGNATTALNYTIEEDFSPEFDFGDDSDSPFTYPADDANGNKAGDVEIRFTDVPYFTKDATTTIKANGFASQLNSQLKLKTRALGADKWSDGAALSFTYDETNNRYAAKLPSLDYGTDWKVVWKEDNSVTWSDAAVVYGGHAPKLSYSKNKETKAFSGTYWYLTESPAYIVNNPDNRDSAPTPDFSKGNYSVGNIANTQNNVIDADVYTNKGYVTFSISSTYAENYNIRFDAVGGFVITDQKYNKLKTKDPIIEEADDKGTLKVRIELEDKNLSMSNIKCWVGDGTTIKGNKSYSSQTKFGTEKYSNGSVLPGYVMVVYQSHS